MAAINLYLADSAGDGWQTLTENTQPVATIVGGWVVGTGATNHSEFAQGVERAASTFVSNGVPDASLDTVLHDAFRSLLAYTGDFASANWVFHFVVRAVTNGGAQDGRVRFRIIKADADGSNATEITTGHLLGSIVTNVSTSADFDSTLTVNPGAFSISNQHIFIQLAWERTGAGGMSTSDIDFRTGSSTSAGTRITTADFTAGTSPTRGRISFAELETPFVATRGRVSFAELEVPLQATRGRISWAEFEAPIAPTRGRISFTELEAPIAPTRGRVSFSEFEVPSLAPDPTRGRISWSEFEAGFAPTRGRVSWTEMETPVAPTRGRISFTAFEVPDIGGGGEGLSLYPQWQSTIVCTG